MPDSNGNDAVLNCVLNSQGRTIYFDPMDRRGEVLSDKHGEVYPDSSELWRRALELADEWDVVADVGANYGEMLAGAELSHARRIVAFEPNPAIAAFLRRTIAELPWEVELLERAVSDHSQADAHLFITDDWSGTSHLSGADGEIAAEGETLMTVPQTTLSEEIGGPDVHTACVKVDVEGFEPQVLKGARQLFETVERVVVMLEILHTAVEDVWELSKRHPVYLLDRQTKQLVRWTGKNGQTLGLDLHSGRYYRQDAIILAGSDVEAFDRELTERVGTTTAQHDTRIAGLQSALAEKDELISSLRKRIDAKNRELDTMAAELEKTRRQRDVAQSGRETAEAELEAIKRSRMYRIAEKVWATRRILLRR